MLRDFLYLNTDAVTSYLSQLEGYTELSIDETLTKQGKRGLKAGYSTLGGELSADNTSSTKRTLATTDEARFQRLYEMLTERKQIQFLDAFDDKIWQQIKRGEILEIPAKVKVPKFLLAAKEIQGLMPLLDIVKSFDLSVEDEKIKGISAVTQNLENKPIPIVFQASTLGYQFSSNLERKYLRCQLEDLKSGGTVVGKVNRILQKGEKETVFNLAPDIENITNLNRKQRRATKRQEIKDISEEIKGPAILLTTTAIFL